MKIATDNVYGVNPALGPNSDYELKKTRMAELS
jgi:hypothetical protein